MLLCVTVASTTGARIAATVAFSVADGHRKEVWFPEPLIGDLCGIFSSLFP